jgi:hypothetical protein
VSFVGLTADNREDAERFLGDMGIEWQNGYGAKKTLDALGPGVPMVYVIGSDGRVIWSDHRSRWLHAMDPLHYLLPQALEKALKDADASVKATN